MEHEFAERLKEALSIRNMSQQQLVNKTGIGKSTISQYISGKYKAKQDNISKIADVLNINETWLMGISKDMNRNRLTSIQENVGAHFVSFDSAMQFIIKSPVASAYGGYDIDKMSEDEIIDFANELAEMFKIMAKRHQK